MPWQFSPRLWSIRTKSVVLVILYVLALYGVYGGFTLYLLHRESLEAQDRFEQTAKMVATQLDAHLEAGQQKLTMVATLPGLSYGLQTLFETQNGGEFPAWTTLHYIFLQSPVFTGGMFLLDQEGKVRWTEPPSLPGVGQWLSSLPAIAELYKHGQLVVSAGIEADQFLPYPHVIMAVPIRGPTGETTGILGGVIDLTGPALVNILGGVSTVRNRFVEILDQEGRVIASTKKDRLLQRFSVEPQQEDALLMASADLQQAPWRVASGQPRSIVFADVSRMHHFLWWCGFGMILLAIAVGAPFVNKVVGPIKQLTNDAERMAGGDLSQPVEIRDRHDEIATLSRAFEHMRVELDRSRTELEQRLQEREELIRLKEEFLANISHELRTPLHVVMGYADMLLEQESDELKRSMLGHVRTKADQLFRLMSDLMTVSGLNTGKVALQVSSVMVADLLDRLEPLAEQLRGDKDLEIVWDSPTPLPVMETDGLRLEQVLTNLVTNAVKFTQKGQVIIRTRQAVGQGLIIFEVSDTGIGIPAEELPSIFDEFRQVDGSISRRYGGMGLGLALVKKLVSLLQGEISVISQLGQGTAFTVTFPLRLSPSPTAEKMRSAPPLRESAPSMTNNTIEVEKRIA
ncbi:MAG: sensor histidine kinase [Deltaproteobacteria bacterium]|nr:sensor histidine kinase [Deltaproteobacteria bacterium]